MISGTHHSENSRKKMSDKLKGRKVWNKGKALSENHKKNLSLSPLVKNFLEFIKKKFLFL